jgi:hypothetical protein
MMTRACTVRERKISSLPKMARSDLRIAKPSIWQILGRVVLLSSVLMLGACIAFCWFSRGISWVWDTSLLYSPLLRCPQFVLNARELYPSGPLCRMSLAFSAEIQTRLETSNLMTKSTEPVMGQCSLSSLTEPEYVYCYWDSDCDNLCSIVGTDNEPCRGMTNLINPLLTSDPSLVPQCAVNVGSLGTIQAACYYVYMNAYCDSEFKVTPSNEVAMRGIIVASGLLTLIWLIAEFILRRVEIRIQKERRGGHEYQAESLPAKISKLRQMLEERREWDDKHSQSLGAVRVTPGRAGSVCSTPRNSCVSGTNGSVRRPTSSRRFTMSAWKRRVSQYHSLRVDQAHSFKPREFLRSAVLYICYFGLLICTLFIIVTISPQHISLAGGSSGGFAAVIAGQVSLWQVHSALDIVVFIDIILDTGLFLAAAFTVKWPRSPLFARHLQNKLDEYLREWDETFSRGTDIEQGTNVTHEKKQRVSDETAAGMSLDVCDSPVTSVCLSSEDTESLSFVLKQSVSTDCCLLIACHESTLTRERAEIFSATLKSALYVFPPGHIFICDNGNSMHPVDDTEMIAMSVHADINYLYIPEGNKTFAFYWCNRYWIPVMHAARKVPNFTYALIMDDDVPLPADLHIPHEHLRQHAEVKAIHFPITAIGPPDSDGVPTSNLLIQCQDVEYKLAAVHKQFQSTMSRCLSAHGAVALWERKAMEEVFFSHDTVFHGEDLMMGLCLLKKRDTSRIISAAQSIVPTYAPSDFGTLFRQRVKSWELTSHRKTLTYIGELLNPRSWFHVPSLILKPYFLQETITILLDWLRVYLLCGLFLRDWIGLFVMTGLFMSLLYVQVLLFAFFVLRSRQELRPSVWTIIAFPLYRLCGLVFRICALCQNLIVYSHHRTAVKIGKREDEIRDVPPIPPHYLVDWFTVWRNPSIE